MNNFEYYCPTKVIFGAGILNTICKFLPASSTKALLISSNTAAIKSGAYDIISKAMLANKTKLYYKNIVSPNPRIEEVDRLAKFIIKNDIDVLIGVGGGSVIDAAKAASLCASKKISARELLNGDIADISPLFLIAVPTTAGTGSEVSKGAIVTDQKNTWKGGIRGENVFPKVAILDPEMTRSLPEEIVLETGFDVLTHSFESLISKASTPITRVFSKQSLELAIPALVKVARCGTDNETRRDLMFASLLAGYNLANASTCLPHRLQYPLGAHTDSSHARGLAALYPAWLESTYKFASIDTNYLVNIMSQAMETSPLNLNQESVVGVLNEFLILIKMNHKLRDFGVKKEECEIFANEVGGNLALDPGCTKIETLINIYKEAW